MKKILLSLIVLAALFSPCFSSLTRAQVTVFFDRDILILAPRTDLNNGLASEVVTAIIEPDTTVNKNADFSSSLPGIVTVEQIEPDWSGNPRALVTARVTNQRVTAEITVRTETGQSAVLPVEVVYVPVKWAHIEHEGENPDVLVLQARGKEGLLNYRLEPQDATNQNVRLVSSDPWIADVEDAPVFKKAFVQPYVPGTVLISLFPQCNQYDRGPVSARIDVVEAEQDAPDEGITEEEAERLRAEVAARAEEQAKQILEQPVIIEAPAAVIKTVRTYDFIRYHIPGTIVLEGFTRYINDENQQLTATIINEVPSYLLNTFGPTITFIDLIIGQVTGRISLFRDKAEPGESEPINN